MMSLLAVFPSRAHAAAAAAFVAAAACFAVDGRLAAIPLALFVAACAVAPFFPAWSFFVPTVLRGPRSRRDVALTFDDGPDPRTLRPLLDLLAREQVPATFFVVGRRAAANPRLVSEILAAGHEVGNHSATHDPILMLRSTARLRDEVVRCQEAIAAAGAVPLVFRPPVGITNPRLLGVLRSLGLTCVMFSCRPLDFANRRLAGLRHRVLDRVRPGDIVLLHDMLPPKVAVADWLEEVAAILIGIREKGLRVVALSDLMGRPVMRRDDGTRPHDDVTLARASAGVSGNGGPGATVVSSLSTAARILFVAGYPLLVLFGVSRFGPRAAALMLLAVFAAARLPALRRGVAGLRGLGGLNVSVAALLVTATLLDDTRYMLAYPSLVNAALLVQFAWSMRGERSMVERFARLQVSDLTAGEMSYCRTVTVVWCAFFLANGAAATVLAIAAPRAWWAVYTGIISYVLVGVLFGAEYLVRKMRFGRYGRNPLDRLLLRLFGNAAQP